MKRDTLKDRCPKCGSANIDAARAAITGQPFDYIKQCNNNKCSYHVNHPKGWRYQWMMGEHN